MKNLFLLLPLLLLGATSLKPIKENPVLDKYLVPFQSEAKMPEVALLFEVEHKTEQGYEIIVPRNKANELLKLVSNAKLITSDLDARWTTRAIAGFHNFQAVQDHLKKLADTYPNLITLEEYGKSMEGRPLVALRLLSHEKSKTKKPRLMITSATHGDELITVEVLFGLLEQLVTIQDRIES